jgi:hypothetical protein
VIGEKAVAGGSAPAPDRRGFFRAGPSVALCCSLAELDAIGDVVGTVNVGSELILDRPDGGAVRL